MLFIIVISSTVHRVGRSIFGRYYWFLCWKLVQSSDITHLFNYTKQVYVFTYLSKKNWLLLHEFSYHNSMAKSIVKLVQVVKLAYFKNLSQAQNQSSVVFKLVSEAIYFQYKSSGYKSNHFMTSKVNMDSAISAAKQKTPHM